MQKLTILAVLALAFLREQGMAQTVNLGSAADFAIVAGAGVTNTGTTIVTGDVGTHPTPSQTGFGSISIDGTNHVDDAVTQLAKTDLVTAYNDAAGRTPSIIYAPASDLGGLTLVAGVYNNSSSFGLTGVLTLDAGGDPNAVWVFQAGSTLITASNSSVLLINGAQACHVFWQVGSSATLGTGSNFSGNILALTDITAGNGASVLGRLLARNGAVSLDTNTITRAICQQLMIAVEPTTTTSTTTTRPGSGGSDRERGGPTAKELETALILAAQTVDTVSARGLTSIYTLGFAQFDTEVFSLQQRLADIRGASRRRAPDINDTNPIPTEQNPWSGKNVRGGKNPWHGKNASGREGVQPKEVQMDDDLGWGFFITATGDFATMGDDDGTSIGTTLGVDCRISEHFVVGVSVGYARSEVDLFDGSKVESDGAKVAIYALYTHGGFYTEGLVGGGYNSYDTRRSAFLGDARGDTGGVQFDSYLGIGYDITMGGWTVTPMASVLYTLVSIDGYNEIGSLVPLNIESQHAGSLRTRVGPRIEYTTEAGGVHWTPSISAQWQHEFLDDELPLEARFANDTESLFTVYGPNLGRDSILLTAALNISWRRYAAYLAYQANFGRENYENHTALAGLRVSW